jgi:membrane-associated protein
VEWITSLIDLFLHLDKHLGEAIQAYDTWIYLILFVIVFCETGLVVTPFLPGDSLLFAAGTFAAGGQMDVLWLFLLLSAAAILGDTVNYWIGAYIGPRAFSGEIRFLKKQYLDRTHQFYEKHGGKTIILARFIPIIRTFAPFVAGVGAMTYGKFILYNVVGGIVWVAIFLLFGFWFGSIDFVKEHFSLIVLAIIVISVLPLVYEFVRAWMHRTKAAHETVSPGGDAGNPQA